MTTMTLHISCAEDKDRYPRNISMVVERFNADESRSTISYPHIGLEI